MSADKELGLYLNSMFAGVILVEPAGAGAGSVPRHKSLSCVFVEPVNAFQAFGAALFLLGIIKTLSQGRLRSNLLEAGQRYLSESHDY